MLRVTFSVKANIFPAAFSGFWVPDGVNEGGFNPGLLTEEPGKRLQKCTSVPQLLEPCYYAQQVPTQPFHSLRMIKGEED